MRYSELVEAIGVRKFQGLDHSEIMTVLQNHPNIKPLGSGHFAQTYLINNVVYKFWMRDSAYETYINFVKENKNEHYPKFFSNVKSLPVFFNSHQDADKRINYVKMEKLEVLTNTDKIINILAAGVVNKYADIHQHTIADLISSLNSHNYDLKDSFEEFAMWFIYKITWFEVNTLDQIDNTVLGIIRAIYPLMKMDGKNGMEIDFQLHNFMQRGDTLVITDPIMNREDAHYIDRVLHIFSDINKS